MPLTDAGASARRWAISLVAAAPVPFPIAKIELVDAARGPAVSDVDDHDRGVVARSCQLPDVLQYHFVVRRVLDRDEYTLIHQPTDLPKNWSSSQMLSPA